MKRAAVQPSPMAVLAAKSIELFDQTCGYAKGRNYKVEVSPLAEGKDLTDREMGALTYLILNGLELRMAKTGYVGVGEVFYQRRIEGPAGWTLSLTLYLTARKGGERRSLRRKWPVPRRHRAI
jgi:hypothetical protein